MLHQKMAKIVSIIFNRDEQPVRAIIHTEAGTVEVEWREVCGDRCWFTSGTLEAKKLAVTAIERIERIAQHLVAVGINLLAAQVTPAWAAAPKINSISPDSVTGVPLPGRISFTIGGENFVSGATVKVSWNSIAFEVKAPSAVAPKITSISPDSVTGVPLPGRISFSLGGENFAGGATVKVSWNNDTESATIANNYVTVVNSTKINFSVATSTDEDTWKVRVTNPDGKGSNSIAFEVKAPSAVAPKITSISPDSVTGVPLPGRISFSLGGENFAGGATVKVSWNNDTQSEKLPSAYVTVVDSNRVDFSVATGTRRDTWRVRAINPDGKVSNGVKFEVKPSTSPAPQITSISPEIVPGAPLPTRTSFSIVGKTFLGGAAVRVSWNNDTEAATLSSAYVTVVNSTQINFSVATSTDEDTWRVRVTNADGQGSNGINFKVKPSSSGTPILTVTPQDIVLYAKAGSTSLNVLNTGGGTMKYSAAVASGSWLRITSGATGQNSGTIKVSSQLNAGPQRAGTIEVTATAASESPVAVRFIQASEPSDSFAPGDRIKASSSKVNVRDAKLSKQPLFTQEGGVHGTITGLSKQGTAGGFTGTWWEVAWDAGPPSRSSSNGWSAASGLSLVAPAGDVPTPNFANAYYRTDNKLWENGFAPKSTSPPTPKLGASLGNCTWYANGRMQELGYDKAIMDRLINNAGTWDGVAIQNGVLVNGSPAVGAIAQSDKRSGLGHVAVVESVNTDGTITISESSYADSSTSMWNLLWRHRTISPSWFENYIHVAKSSTEVAKLSPQSSSNLHIAAAAVTPTASIDDSVTANPEQVGSIPAADNNVATARGVAHSAVAYTGLLNGDFSKHGYGIVSLRRNFNNLSGKLQVNGQIFSFAEKLGTHGGFSKTFSPLIKSTDLEATLVGRIDENGLLTGRWDIGDGTVYRLDGEQDATGSRSAPFASHGAYEAELVGGDFTANGEDVSGWLNVTVDTNGAAKLVGALPDGVKLYGTTHASISGRIPIAFGLYHNRGYLSGAVKIEGLGSNGTMFGSLRWYKPNATDDQEGVNVDLQVTGRLTTDPYGQ